METPSGWTPLVLRFNDSALPTLPWLAETAKYSLHPCGGETLKHLAWNGDSVLKGAATRALVRYPINRNRSGVDKNWISMFRGRVLSNNVFSYLALSYDLVNEETAATIAQKRAADLFGAYVGASDLKRESHQSHGMTEFLRELFSEAVWPDLQLRFPEQDDGSQCSPATSDGEIEEPKRKGVKSREKWKRLRKLVAERFPGRGPLGQSRHALRRAGRRLREAGYWKH
ncbi:hypothetical protein BD324DRAFT_97017 [Kockovaella imperatae]|uniref:RNase III domain-containing protein n=1 Tax=Kockovaella imperatae TaxID=4999 RepID=A0A1Y1UBK0_9TREE|nr:hypothetical protein BD324DRAFT_97017 [Kockovaella imperatae]ORX35423.1 hypothetical protein BD324DRAFT_97017 [Kockovaella imperatae]